MPLTRDPRIVCLCFSQLRRPPGVVHSPSNATPARDAALFELAAQLGHAQAQGMQVAELGHKHAPRFGVDPRLALSVIAVESPG